MYAVYSSLNSETPIMLLNQPIGMDRENPANPYIDGALFGQEILELDNGVYKSLCVHINSPGGNVVEGYNICNAILQSKLPVDTMCTGIAASMAATVFMMGRKRIMADYSSLMIHNPFGGDDKKMLGALRDSLIKMVSAKCKVSEDEVQKMMARETWLSAEEALEKGFCTEIVKTSETNQHRMPKASVYAMWNEANNIQNYTTSKKENMSDNTQAKATGLGLIANYLELNVEASESAILTALRTKVNTEIQARTKAEDSVSELQSQMKKKEQEMEDLRNQLSKANNEMKEIKDAAAAAQAKAEKETKEAADAKIKAEAKAYIQPFVDAKRIAASQVDFYVETAVTMGMEKVKAALGDAPVNKKQPAEAKVETGAAAANGAIDPNEVPANAMSYMARIQANQNAKYKREAAVAE